LSLPCEVRVCFHGLRISILCLEFLLPTSNNKKMQ
jgi:hypothetical protein